MTDNNRIRAVRERRGLTQSQLGELIGKSQPEVSRLEIPSVAPRPKTLRKIAAALDVSPHDLLVA